MRLAVGTWDTDLVQALGLGAEALRLAHGGEPALLSACAEGEALVLGRVQRLPTLRRRSAASFAAPLLRRFTTGTEAQLAGPTLYHALALPRVDALFPDAKPRTLLNRNLRALLRGYAAASVPLRYFGTEVLALLGHPVALVGYDVSEQGAVLIEVLLGLQQPCVVRPALRREPPAALFPLLGAAPEPSALLARVVAGVVERLGIATRDVSGALVPSALPPLDDFGEEAVSEVSVPLGVVEAARSPRARISGDLLVSTAALSRLERAVDTGGLSEATLASFDGAALDGARPSDLWQALLTAP